MRVEEIEFAQDSPAGGSRIRTMPTVERDISIGEAGDVSIGDLQPVSLTDREVTNYHR
jgi:hypothetical protein